MGKNKALAHHTSTYFHTRRVYDTFKYRAAVYSRVQDTRNEQLCLNQTEREEQRENRLTGEALHLRRMGGTFFLSLPSFALRTKEVSATASRRCCVQEHHLPIKSVTLSCAGFTIYSIESICLFNRLDIILHAS